LPNWRTAITRKTISRPASILSNRGLLEGERILDYGCGRSIDYTFHDNMERYDPHFHPTKPEGKYDVIMCNYVINVVDAFEQEDIINHIKSLLKPNGKAYFTVRRDIKENIPYFDYTQRVVELPFKSLVRNCAFEIYEYQHESKD
jgi:2-polyprenyl-3-methyl-5-hydroxy-6-metoxy-1,4-benzoquinol methylase